jgi:hypothetical protein
MIPFQRAARSETLSVLSGFARLQYTRPWGPGEIPMLTSKGASEGRRAAVELGLGGADVNGAEAVRRS